MVVKEQISANHQNFLTLCKEHHVKFLYAFGSSTNDQFKEDSSDIDLLVEIENEDPIERGEMLLSLWDDFEAFFHRKVDLLTESSIRNSYLRKNIEATKILLYDGKRSQIFS